MQGALELASALSATGLACCYGTKGTAKMSIVQAVAEDRCYATYIRDDVIAFESDREDDAVLQWVEYEKDLLDNPPLIELSRGAGNRCHIYFFPGSKREAEYLTAKAVEFGVMPDSRMIRPPETLYKDGTTRSLVVGEVPDWVWELPPPPPKQLKDAAVEDDGHVDPEGLPDSEIPEEVQEILDNDWPNGMRSDAMIEAENGMLHLPPDERYRWLRTNRSFWEKMDKRSAASRGWDFYVKYIQARTPTIDLDRRFTEIKGGTAPRTPRELIEGRRRGRILLDHQLNHPDPDEPTHVMLVEGYQDALKHGDLGSAGLRPRDDAATRHACINQQSHHHFLHRKGHPLYIIDKEDIGVHGRKTVANLWTRRAQEIVATYDRHHPLQDYPTLDDPIHDTPEDTPEDAWHRLLKAQYDARRTERWGQLRFINDCIDACLPKSAIRSSSWRTIRRDRTPLGTSNDYQNARRGWVRERRTDCYIDIMLPRLETFLAWEQELRPLQRQKRWRHYEPSTLGSPPVVPPEERLRQLRQSQELLAASKRTPPPGGFLNRRCHSTPLVVSQSAEPSRGPPDACWRLQQLKRKYTATDLTR